MTSLPAAVGLERTWIEFMELLSLLARDPAQRPSMDEFCVSCDQVLAGSVSVQV